MLSRITNRLSHPLYVFARKPALSSATFLPLYQSSVFKSTHSGTQPTTSTRSSRRASRPSATSSSSPPSSRAYLSSQAANAFLPSALPLHLSRLRPRKRGAADRHSPGGRLPDAGVLYKSDRSLELQRYHHSKLRHAGAVEAARAPIGPLCRR